MKKVLDLCIAMLRLGPFLFMTFDYNLFLFFTAIRIFEKT